MAAVQSKRSVIVGIFIFFGLAILAGGILVVGGKRKTFEDNIVLYAIFDNVNGLQRGNNVWFSGVKIGMVKHLRIVGNGKVRVEMKVEESSRRFILGDARAKIASDGLIGNKVIEIYGGTVGTPAVHPDDTLITELGPNMGEMMGKLQESNRNLGAITENFRRVSDRLVRGEGTVGSLLTSNELAMQLQSTAARLQAASANIQTLTSNINAYTNRLQTKGSLANELVSDTMLYHTLRASATQIQLASANANTLTQNLKQISYDLKDSTNNVAGVLLHDPQSAATIKDAIGNIQSGTKKFDEDMEALQHNFLFRRFFKKREKQRAKQQQQVPQNTPIAEVH